jgi:hypothetical protein
MAAEPGTPIVERALELAARHPKMAAVHVLDAAMQGHHGRMIDFRRDSTDRSCSDWLDPPSAFAELLRRAFGAHLPKAEIDAQSPAWEFDVIDAFAERYDIVPAGIGDEGCATITHDGAAPAAITPGPTGASRGGIYAPPSGAMLN